MARHGAVVAQFMPNAGENPVFTFARNIKQMSDQRVGKAQHIMLKTTEQGGKTGTIEEAYAKIEDWKARAGTDAGKFAEIAIAESEDEQTAKDGGDLGVILRGRLPRQLEDAIYGAKAPDGGFPTRTARTSSSARWRRTSASTSSSCSRARSPKPRPRRCPTGWAAASGSGRRTRTRRIRVIYCRKTRAALASESSAPRGASSTPRSPPHAAAARAPTPIIAPRTPPHQRAIIMQQNDDASAMLRGMLNIGGSAPAAPAPSAQQLAAQQLAAAQQQLAELEAKHGKIQEAFAQMHTVPPEQQPGVQQQLLALRQQVVQQHQQQQQVVAQMQMKMMQVMAAPPQQVAPLAGLVTATAPALPGMAQPALPGFAPPGAPPAAAPPGGPPGLPPGLGMGAPPPQPAAAAAAAGAAPRAARRGRRPHRRRARRRWRRCKRRTRSSPASTGRSSRRCRSPTSRRRTARC